MLPRKVKPRKRDMSRLRRKNGEEGKKEIWSVCQNRVKRKRRKEM